MVGPTAPPACESVYRRCVFLAVLLISVAGGSAAAADVPTADALRERIRSAAGTPPPTSHSVLTYEANGFHGRHETYRSGDDFREIVEEGPFTTQSGRFEKQAWHQNENGETVLDQPDPGAATKDTYTTSVRAIATPIIGYVIAELNLAGSGTREYVDSATWHVVRRERIRPIGTTTYAYDDFRTVDGRTRAWHWTVRDGHAENDAEYRLEREAHDVRASDVAIAAPRGRFVSFPAGKQRIALPVHAEGGRFYVRLMVGARGLDFLLDTGAGGITIDENVARQLGLEIRGRYSTAESAGRYKSGRVLVANVAIGELTMHNVTMDVTPPIERGGGNVRAVGLLGFDFIGALALELDYQHGAVTAIEPAAFVPPVTPHTIALDIRLGTQQPMTDVAINGAVGERFIVDTGASAPLMIFDYFMRRHRKALVDLGAGLYRERRYSGVGGDFETQPFQLASIRLGTAEFKNFLAFAVRSKTAYTGDEDGLFGAEFLSLFNVYLDYGESRIYLEPNDVGRAASGR